tara:strand:+ start:660 stop:1778 length:1119 start_codon:yes stop_codon:yes gene_type:complete
MISSRFFQNKIIIGLIVMTVILFFIFDVATQFLIKAEFDERVRDSVKFQAMETDEVLKDLEDGLSLIDESMSFNVSNALKGHVDIVMSIIDEKKMGMEAVGPNEDDKQGTTSATQSEVLKSIESFRKHIDGTMAVYSLDKGMLLYPDGENGRINLYFNSQNKDILQSAVSQGSLFGTIKTTDILRGESVLSGYFAYEDSWKWLIFAVKEGAYSKSYREYGEDVTIRSGLNGSTAYEIVESAFVLNPYYYYEFGVKKDLIGRKVSKIDLKTNKDLSQIYSENMNGFVEYAIMNDKTEQAEEKLAYILKSRDDKHIIVIQADVEKYKAITSEIVGRLRMMTLAAFMVSIVILVLLYQNFVILIDPIAEQQGGRS